MLQEAEFRNLFLRHAVRKPSIIFLLFFIIVIFALLLWLGIISKSASVLGFLVIYCVVVCGFGGFLLPKLKYRSEVRRGRIQQRTVSVDQSGVDIVTKDVTTNIGWEKIKKVKQDNRFVWLIVDRKSKIAIPRRAFQTSSESDEFYRDMRNFIGSV